VEDARRSQGCIQPTPTEQALHDALDDALGSKGVNPKLFGYWARRLKRAHNGGFILEIEHDRATNSNLITVRPTGAVAIVPGSPGSPGSIQP
jgi:hypothetical protein